LKTIQKLENILSELEDLTWIVNLAEKISGRSPFFPESNQFRLALQSRDKEEALSCVSAYAKTARNDSGFNFQRDAALDLYHWFFDSQRVFTLSSNLTEMLLATNLPDFKLNEINLSVPSFAIQLEHPIQLQDERWYDFIIFRSHHNDDGSTARMSVRIFEQTYSDYKPLTERKKKIVNKDAEQRNARSKKFADKMTRQAEGRKVIGYSVVAGSNSLSEAISKSAPENEKLDWVMLYQIGIGLNLYLQTARLPEDTECIAKFLHPKVVPKDARKHFTNNTELFSLGTSQAFSRHKPSKGQERDFVGSVRPHFRRGYWRRPSGFGSDPNANATIWVRPTWVHQDKIDAGEKPTGSNQNVSTLT